jgi:hypothetical protein
MSMFDGMQSGGGGLALVRAAEAMLRAVGGAEVTLLFPRATAGDVATQLGMVAAGIEEVRMAPAAVRSRTAETRGGHVRVEFLLPASEVATQVESRQAQSAKAFFEAALGIVHDGRLLRVTQVEADRFGDTVYLWRVTAEE